MRAVVPSNHIDSETTGRIGISYTHKGSFQLFEAVPTEIHRMIEIHNGKLSLYQHNNPLRPKVRFSGA